MPWLCTHRYVHPCIHIPRGPSWPIMWIPFTIVFLCENVQLALTVSPRIATDLVNVSSRLLTSGRWLTLWFTFVYKLALQIKGNYYSHYSTRKAVDVRMGTQLIYHCWGPEFESRYRQRVNCGEQCRNFRVFFGSSSFSNYITPIFSTKLAALAQMVAHLPLVQRVRDSIPGEVVNFHLKNFKLQTRRGGDVQFLIAGLYIIGLD